MPADRPPSLAASVRNLGPGPDVPDGQLLDRFLAHRDEAAFAALVDRHGPMALGVCRRILANEADAEDALQAAFLVLARRAKSLAGRAVLGDWLHGVARRTALKARAARARRQAKERDARTAGRTAEESRNDWLPALDRELARLPEKYRQPIVLCDLEGRTRDEAARLLDWPPGSVAGRLARGRALLAKRLLRATVVAAAPAALRPALAAATAHAAVSGETGSPVVELADLVMRSVLAGRAKVTAAVVSFALLGVGIAAHGLGPGRPAPPPGQAPAGADPANPLAGVWRVREADATGKHLPRDVSTETVWTITDGRIVIQYPDGERAEWTFTHDPTGLPPAIDLKQTAGPLSPRAALGVYERAGDTLRIAYQGGDDRPKSVAEAGVAESRSGRFYVLEPVPVVAEHPAAARARAGRPRLAHLKNVSCAEFSPDGRTLATGGHDRFVRLWDPATGEQVHALRHYGWVRTLAWHPDGKTLFTGSDAEGVRQWEAAIGKELRRFGRFGGMATSLAVTRDGKTLAYAEESRTVVVRHVAGDRELFRFAADDRAYRLAFSPDGKVLAVGGEQKRIRRREIPSGRELPALEGHAGGTYAVAFSPDGRWVASGGTHPDGTIHLWDAATGKEVRRWAESLGAVYALAFAPDSATLLSGQGGSGRSVRLWDVPTGRHVRAFGGMTDNLVDSVTFAADGKTAASVGCWGRGVYLWDVASGREVSPFPRHHGEVEAVALSPDGRLLATGSADRTVGLWDGAGRPAGRFRGHAGAVTAVAFAPDGRLVASAARGEKVVRLWSAATGGPVRELAGGGPAFRSVAFSPDGRTLAAGEADDTLGPDGARPRDGAVRLWDVATGKEVRQFHAKAGRAHAIAFCTDGRLLATAGPDDAAVHLWDPDTGLERSRFERPAGSNGPPARFEGTSAVAFSPDGRALAAVSFYEHKSNVAPPDPARWQAARAVTVWEVATGRVRHEVRLPWNAVTAVAFAGGRFLLAGDREGALRVLDLSDGGWLPARLGHFDALTALAVAPDGRAVASGSRDTTALVWRTDALTGGRPPAQARKTAPELEALWQALTGEDATKADRAGWVLAAAPEAVDFLKARVPPTPAADEARMKALVAGLDAASFRAREEATAELGRLADVAAPALRAVVARPPSAEAGRRAEGLLARLSWDGRDPVAARAVEVLERAGTAAARALLETLALGNPAARQTRDAKESVDRLRRGAR